MAFDATEQHNAAAARRAYLLQLRERAMQRMRVDEQALADPAGPHPVSRRDSLRWLGLAAAAVAARPLRALAEGTLSERAERIAGLRSPAPQYGVPAMAQPGVPYEEGDNPPKLWAGVVQTAKSRAELADPEHWTVGGALVIASDGRFPGAYQRVKSWVVFYAGPWEHPHSLQAVVNWSSNRVYVVPGGQNFWVEQDGALWGFLIQGKQLFLRKSFYAKALSDDVRPADILSTTLHGFLASVSDETLRAAEKNATVIDLSGVLPGDGAGDVSITGVTADHGKVAMQVGSNDNVIVDLKTKKLTTW